MILASFQEAQTERRQANAATEARIAALSQTIATQRAKQENLWEEVASLPKTATSARTALHNVLNRLEEAIAEGEGQIDRLRAMLLPVPADEALTPLFIYQAQIHEGLHAADTVEKRRAVIDALNVTVSAGRDDQGKAKATLHWWGTDTPLPLDDNEENEE